MKKDVVKLASSLILVLFTAACGGGGGGDGGNGPSGPGAGGPAQIGALTSANADLVLFTALTNVRGIYSSLQLQGGVSLLTAATRLDLAKINNEGVSGSDPCSLGGATDWMFTDADADNQFSTGDTWTFDHKQCVKMDTTQDGTESINFVKFDPAIVPPAEDSDIQFVLDLTGTLFGTAYTYQGSFSLVTFTNDGITTQQTISSPAMTGTLLSTGMVTLQNFMVSVTANSATKDETLTMSADITDPVLGTYKVTTGAPLQGNNIPLLGGADMYAKGSFTIMKDGNQARLTAIDSQNVTIEIDVDGMPGYEQSIDTTWQALVTTYLNFMGLTP